MGLGSSEQEIALGIERQMDKGKNVLAGMLKIDVIKGQLQCLQLRVTNQCWAVLIRRKLIEYV